jgi:hypothetical protein
MFSAVTAEKDKKDIINTMNNIFDLKGLIISSL